MQKKKFTRQSRTHKVSIEVENKLCDVLVTIFSSSRRKWKDKDGNTFYSFSAPGWRTLEKQDGKLYILEGLLDFRKGRIELMKRPPKLLI